MYDLKHNIFLTSHKHESTVLKTQSQIFNLSEDFQKFSLLTSLHGFKYLGEKRPFSEKIFWATVLISVFILCGIQTFDLVQYWNEGRIILTQENARFHVWDVPFPAITICSDNQLNRSALTLAKNELEPDLYQDVKEYADTLCYTNYYANFTDNKISRRALLYALQKLALSCNDTFVRLIWNNDLLEYSCRYTQPIILQNGICYSLNMVPYNQLLAANFANELDSYSTDRYFFFERNSASSWTPSSGFRDSRPLAPPWRVAGGGSFNAVTMILDLGIEHFRNYCNVSGTGIMAIVHSPIEYPNYVNSYYIRPNNFYIMSLTPRIETASEELKSWKPTSRGCYYEHEKFLKYFKIYTQNNCELECRANRTRKMCGCVAYYHPRFGKTPICGLAHRRCVNYAGTTGFSLFGNKSVVDESTYYHSNCLCLPSCVDLTYDVSIGAVERNFTHIRDINPSYSTAYKDIAILHLYFKREAVDGWHRSPMIRCNELIANVGGVMSLCLGCSIISLFEVVYFVILQKCFMKSRVFSANTTVKEGPTPVFLR